MRVAVVLPAYNEARALPGLLSSLAGLGELCGDLRLVVVVVVDDGSSDETAEIALRSGAEVVSHPSNRGLGAALLGGLKAASDADVVLTMNAGGTVGLEVARRLLVAVVGGAGVAVTSRCVAGAEVKGVPSWHRVLSRAASWLVRLVLGLPVRDCTSGFRAYSGGVLRRVLSRWGDGLVTCTGGRGVRWNSCGSARLTRAGWRRCRFSWGARRAVGPGPGPRAVSWGSWAGW